MLTATYAESMEIKLTDFGNVFQVVQTRLTSVDKSWLVIKPFNFDKNRLAAFHLSKNKESEFY